MVRSSVSIAVALVLIASARGGLDGCILANRKGGAGGIEHRRVVVTDNATSEQATLDLAIFSTKSATLRVIDNPTGDDSLAPTMRREHCLAGVNGGYFDPEDKPVGLLISEGKIIGPFRKAKLLSGVMVVANGRVELLRATEYSPKRKAAAALQCGPFLVDRGQPVPGLNDTRSARRTFIITGPPDRAAVGFCSEVTLAQLAEILATPAIASDLKVQRALNLDGGSSSAFWFAGERGAFSISEQKTVRDFVAVVPK